MIHTGKKKLNTNKSIDIKKPKFNAESVPMETETGQTKHFSFFGISETLENWQTNILLGTLWFIERCYLLRKNKNKNQVVQQIF